jgi:hypothetical protein
MSSILVTFITFKEKFVANGLLNFQLGLLILLHLFPISLFLSC